MKIAITGGIGSGKSYVCKMLSARGIGVYDCDAAAKRLMNESEEIRQKLSALVGDDVYQGSRLVKSVMSKFLLASKEHTHAVNDIVHPAVAEDFEQSGLDWMESAIFFGSGFYKRVHIDKVVCVTAPLEMRISRVMARDGISCEKTLDWINKQISQDEMLSRSDYEIVNDRLHNVDSQLDELLKKIEEK